MLTQAYRQASEILSKSSFHFGVHTVQHAHHSAKQGYILAEIQGPDRTKICHADHNLRLMAKAPLR